MTTRAGAPRPTDAADVSAVAVSEELMAPLPAPAGGGQAVELCYQTFGDPDDEPLLLVMGLGGPLTWWPEDLCRLLATRGFFVVRYDNRDVGRSTRIREKVTKAQIVGGFLGVPVHAPYRISDLATDAAGLLDHLGVDSAHVVGMSMGGMIAQTLATEHPTRVRSLTSIMSTTGKRVVGWQNPRLLPGLLAPQGRGIEGYVETSLHMWKLIGSPGYPDDEEALRERAVSTWERGFSNAGLMRQMLAVVTQPDRTEDLARVTVPTGVIHGLADRMVHVSGGRATARAVPGAELMLVEGMGHDLPADLFGRIVDTVRHTADRAHGSAA